MASFELALAISIGAVVSATLFRTFLPLFIKIRAEADLAERENRPAVVPKIDNIWLYLAGINIVMVGFPLFGTIDQFMEPVMNATSPLIAFFIVFGLANTALEGLFRLGDSGIAGASTRTTEAKPTQP